MRLGPARTQKSCWRRVEAMDSYSEPGGLVEAIWRWLQRMLRFQRALRPHSAAPPEGGSRQPPTAAQVSHSIPFERKIERLQRDPPLYPSEQKKRTAPIDATALANSVASELARVVTGASPPGDVERDARLDPRLSAPADTDTPADENLFQFPAMTPEKQPAADAPAVVIARVVADGEQPLSYPPMEELKAAKLPAGLINALPPLPTLVAACSPEIAEPSKLATAPAIAAPNACPSEPTPPEDDHGASPPPHPPSAHDDEAVSPHLATLAVVNGPTAAPLDLEPRPAAKYTPRLGRSSASIGPVRPLRPAISPEPSGLVSLDAELVMTFNPGEWGITLSFLLHRRTAMPEEITVRLGPDRYNLCAIADDLFEPVAVAQSTSR
jgi:hypothetical protein